VPHDVQDRIFNPFFSTKRTGEGTGLGLSISDGIVREHGGQIRLASSAGQGTVFVVELPVTMP
jgi:signal transduction histidine kinase